ncbi:MAG: sigma factor, partial [Planctomycetota bacterium]|nr:sigma factor [Planctomycetota bacterium]
MATHDLGGAAFPSTCWSRLLEGEDGRQGLETLATRYWRPVAAYVRTRWARSDEEALDAAQDYFLWVLEAGLLAKVDPTRGSFRGFLKASLANFVHDQARKRRTRKRGGDHHFVPLDVTLELTGGDASPEEAL